MTFEFHSILISSAPAHSTYKKASISHSSLHPCRLHYVVVLNLVIHASNDRGIRHMHFRGELAPSPIPTTSQTADLRVVWAAMPEYAASFGTGCAKIAWGLASNCDKHVQLLL